MEQNFTHNHLVKFLYKETTATETLAINKALTENWNLREQYQELVGAYQQLPKVKFQPSMKAIQNILGYSEHTAVQTHH